MLAAQDKILINERNYSWDIHEEYVPSPLNMCDSHFLTLVLGQVDDFHTSSLSEYPISELSHSPHDKVKNDSSNSDPNDICREVACSLGGIQKTIYCGLNHEAKSFAED